MSVSLSPLLYLFSPEQIGLLSRYGESVTFEAGDVVIHEGQENVYLYLLLSGELSVYSEGSDGGMELGRISPGQTIGEMSLFDPNPASATVKALEDTETWRISIRGLEDYRDDYPLQAYELTIQVCKVLSHRLRVTTKELANARI